jgi:hypothetical protein
MTASQNGGPVVKAPSIKPVRCAIYTRVSTEHGLDQEFNRANLNERGAAAVIPSKADRAGRIPHDAEMYKWRHLVENFFCQLKAFRRIATRYEKTDACFAGFLNLVVLFLACR